MYCKICTGAKGLSKESQGRNIKILHSKSVNVLVFKNNNWPTCVYMTKYNTNRGDIFSIKIRWTKTKESICY